MKTSDVYCGNYINMLYFQKKHKTSDDFREENERKELDFI